MLRFSFVLNLTYVPNSRDDSDDLCLYNIYNIYLHIYKGLPNFKVTATNYKSQMFENRRS